MKLTDWCQSLLTDPKTHAPLKRVSRDDVSDLGPIRRAGFDAPQIGPTPLMFATEDGQHGYPISDGVPVLMWPDVLLREDPATVADLRDHRYAEAYSEMEFYNPVGFGQAEQVEDYHGYLHMKRLAERRLPPEAFPEPIEDWLDACFDIQALVDCDRYVAPVTGKTVLQLGGQGRDAVRLLLAGAAEAILVTPMLGEAALAWAVAEKLGLSERFSCVLGVGEEIPLRDEAVDVLISLGCLHHMQLGLALPEIRRVLKVGGRFAAMDPWRAPVYGIGTKLFGKREQKILDRGQSVFCHPITAERLADLDTVFPKHVVNNHGPLLRYPMLALHKFHVTFGPRTMHWLSRIDDQLGRLLRLPSSWGGSLMIGGERT